MHLRLHVGGGTPEVRPGMMCGPFSSLLEKLEWNGAGQVKGTMIMLCLKTRIHHADSADI